MLIFDAALRGDARYIVMADQDGVVEPEGQKKSNWISASEFPSKL